MNEDLEEVKGKAMWFWGIKKREVQARGPSGLLKTQGRKCALLYSQREGDQFGWRE